MRPDPKRPSTWGRSIVNFAVEAMRNERLHKARAQRLVDAGLAVWIGDRCVVTITARDALRHHMKAAVPADSPQEASDA